MLEECDNEWGRPIDRIHAASFVGKTFPMDLMSREFGEGIDDVAFRKVLVNGGGCMSFAGPVPLFEFMSWSVEDYEAVVGDAGKDVYVWCVKLASPSLRNRMARADAAAVRKFEHIGVPLIVRANTGKAAPVVIEVLRSLIAYDVLTVLVSECLRALSLDEVLDVRVATDPHPIYADYTRDVLRAKEETHPGEVKEIRRYLGDACLMANWMNNEDPLECLMI